MATQIQLRRGTATQNNAFTGAVGEVTADTTNNKLRLHDGSTAGGHAIGGGTFADIAGGGTFTGEVEFEEDLRVRGEDLYFYAPSNSSVTADLFAHSGGFNINQNQGDFTVAVSSSNSTGDTVFLLPSGGDFIVKNNSVEKIKVDGDGLKMNAVGSTDLLIKNVDSNGGLLSTAAGFTFKTDTSTGVFKVRNSSNEDMIVANGDGNVELYYNNLKRLETTSSGITISGGIIAGSLTYPTSDGSNGQFLKTDGSGNLTFADAGGGLDNFTEGVSTSSPHSASSGAVKLEASGTPARLDVYLHPKDDGALCNGSESDGNKRGVFAVDWQATRNNADEVASGGRSSILGGSSNKASANWSTSVGGRENTASGVYSFLGGGYQGTSTGNSSTTAGGYSNDATSDYSTIGGGFSNTASSTSATVGGGESNIASGQKSFVGGGKSNTATDTTTVVAGGEGNDATSARSTICGGMNNAASANVATVVGGMGNTASGEYAFIGGGESNTASTNYSFVGGGDTNEAKTNSYATVVGGKSNDATGQYSFVGGGQTNQATGTRSTVGGGISNKATNDMATVGGGNANDATAAESTVAGGSYNDATASKSFIGGGGSNDATAQFSTVAGGSSNTASGQYTSVVGGLNNRADADYATVLGGSYGHTRGTIGKTVFAASGSPIGTTHGYSQAGLLIVGATTSDATTTTLRSNQNSASASNQCVLENGGSLFAFTVTVVGRENATGHYACIKFEGVIDKQGSLDNVTIRTTPTKQRSAQMVTVQTGMQKLTQTQRTKLCASR